jgi:hypothetical protein
MIAIIPLTVRLMYIRYLHDKASDKAIDVNDDAKCGI